MTEPGPSVIETWVRVLSDGGVLHGEREEAGVVAASRVVGESRLSELRDWMAAQGPPSQHRVRAAAIELCIWMAVVDRVIDPSERGLLVEVIRSSTLEPPEQARLERLLSIALSDTRKLAHVETLAEILDHPTLRELMLALSWHVANVDGFVDDLERASFERLAGIFGVDPAVADQIRELDLSCEGAAPPARA